MLEALLIIFCIMLSPFALCAFICILALIWYILTMILYEVCALWLTIKDYIDERY